MSEAGIRGRLFRQVAMLGIRRPGAVAGVTMCIVAMMAILAMPPAIEGDLMRMIPADNPAVIALDAHRKGPGGEDIVAVALRRGTDAGEVAKRLDGVDTVRATFHGLEGDTGLKLAILQLPADRIEKLAEDIHAAIAFRNPTLIEIPGDALAGTPFAYNALSGLGAAADERDKPAPLLIVVPTEPPTDPAFALRLIEDLETRIVEATDFSGPYADIAGAIRDVRQNFIRTSLLALFLVTAIVTIAVRSIVGLAILVVPLILSNLFAVSAVVLVFGSLNLYTAIGGAIVFGLGIDFGIHLITRYREELESGEGRHDAVCTAWSAAGPPCLTAALTSAAGFLAFLVAELEGLRQLGVLLALGVVTSLALMALLLPGMLTRLPLLAHSVSVGRTQAGVRKLFGALAIVVISVLLIPAAPGLQFDHDLSAIKSKGLAWDELTDEQQAQREVGYPPVYIRTDNRNALHRELEERIADDEFKHVRGVVSLDTLLPPDQDDRLAAMERLIAAANHPRRDYQRPALRDFLKRVARLDTAPVDVSEIPDGLRHLVGAEREQVLLLPAGNMLDLRAAGELVDELAEFRDAAVSAFFVEAALGSVITRDLPLVAATTLLIVMTIIIFDLKRSWSVFVALTSLLLGIAWTAGALTRTGTSMNIVNIVALPMLLGIGIDIVVHLVHRVRTGTSIDRVLRTTGVAVLYSTLTTAGAFVSLTLAAHRGIQSIGYVVLIGLAALLVAAVLVVSLAHRRVAARTSI